MRVKRVISSSIFVLLLAACSAPQNPALSLKECGKNGNFCYKGVNYGPSRGPLFEQGIKDGCRTGEGFFTKDYSLSSSSKEYFDGWILGRSHCKQILPNEGTLQEEENSRKRAEYEIRKLKEEQEGSSGIEETSTQEGFIDSIMKEENTPTPSQNTIPSNNEVEEIEY